MSASDAKMKLPLPRQPKYLPEVMQAIYELKDKNGSSAQRIISYVQKKLKRPVNHLPLRNISMHVRRALKAVVDSGEVQERAGLFHLSRARGGGSSRTRRSILKTTSPRKRRYTQADWRKKCRGRRSKSRRSKSRRSKSIKSRRRRRRRHRTLPKSHPEERAVKNSWTGRKNGGYKQYKYTYRKSRSASPVSTRGRSRDSNKRRSLSDDSDSATKAKTADRYHHHHFNDHHRDYRGSEDGSIKGRRRSSSDTNRKPVKKQTKRKTNVKKRPSKTRVNSEDRTGGGRKKIKNTTKSNKKTNKRRVRRRKDNNRASNNSSIYVPRLRRRRMRHSEAHKPTRPEYTIDPTVLYDLNPTDCSTTSKPNKSKASGSGVSGEGGNNNNDPDSDTGRDEKSKNHPGCDNPNCLCKTIYEGKANFYNTNTNAE